MKKICMLFGLLSFTILAEADPFSARLTCTKDKAGCLEVAGKVVPDPKVKGPVRMDVAKFRESLAPMLVHTLEVDEGSFSFYVPENYGTILITAFIDKAGDGPTVDDPTMVKRITIEDKNIPDILIDFTLKKEPIQ